MSIKIDDKNNNNNTAPISQTSVFSSANPYGIAALSAKLYELLSHLQDEISKQESNVGSTESGSTDASSNSQGSTQTNSSSSQSSGPYALAQVMAALIGKNSDLEYQIALSENSIMSQQHGMLDQKAQQSQDDFETWDTNYKAEQYAESHRSRWSKFCHAFTSAFDVVTKTVDKYDPAYMLSDLISNKVTGHNCDLQTAKSGAQTAMNSFNEGLEFIAEKASFGNTGLKIFMEVLLSIAVAAAGGGVEAIAECATAASTEVAAESATAASEIAGEATTTAEKMATSIKNFGKTVAKTFENLGAKLGELPGQLETRLLNLGIPEQSFGDMVTAFKATAAEGGYGEAVVGALKQMTSLSRSESLSLFLKTYVLQNTGFTQDLAKEMSKMGGSELAWEMTISTTLTIVNGFAGYQFATSFLSEGFLSTKMYRTMNILQSLSSISQGIGNIGYAIWDLKLANAQEDLGAIDGEMTENKAEMQIIQAQLQEAQKALTACISSLAENMNAIAQAIPLEAAAGAQALEAVENG